MKRMVKKMGLLIVVLLAVFVVWKTVSAGESETEETESEGRMAVIHVVSIVGNELTYFEEETEAESEEDTGETESEGAREAGSESAESSTGEAENSEEGTEEAESGSTEETTGETGTETTGGNAAISESERMERPSGGMENGGFVPGEGEMEDSGFASGQEPPEVPDFGQTVEETEGDSAQTAEETEASIAGEESTAGQTEAEDSDSASQNQQGGTRGQFMGMGAETKTVYLPVAVTVHTDTGEERTFSILEAGDELEVRLEENAEGEEVITEIWMLGGDGE